MENYKPCHVDLSVDYAALQADNAALRSEIERLAEDLCAAVQFSEDISKGLWGKIAARNGIERNRLKERLAWLVEAGKKILSITECRGFFPDCNCIRCQLKRAIAAAKNDK